MQLPPRLSNLREYHDAIISALAKTTIPIYLDTSMVMWLVTIGREARNEFLEWCRKNVSDRVFVPTWTAHEFYRHLRKETLLADLQSQSTQYQGTLNNLLLDVSLRANDLFCDGVRYRDRSEFVQKARDAALELFEQLNVMKKSKVWYTQGVDEMTAFVNEHITGTNTFDLLEVIQATYEARFNGRIPPGYEDEAKQSNSIGDLVFWQEIIAHVKSLSGTTGIVILTNDNKPDWHHKPKIVLNYAGKETSTHPLVGMEIKLPHPLLQHEAACRVGVEDVFIINPSILSVVLDRTVRSEVRAFAAAIHPRTLRKGEEGINWARIDPLSTADFQDTPTEVSVPDTAAEIPGEPEKTSAQMKADEFDQLLPDALKDLDFPPSDLAELLAKLESAIPDRDDAVKQLLKPTFFMKLNLGNAVLLGRRIFRSASTSGEPALSAISDWVHGSQGTAIENAFVLGMFIDLYFDGHLELRHTPLRGPFEVLFDLQKDLRFQPAIHKIWSLLSPYKESLVVIPSTEPTHLDLSIDLEQPLEGEIKELTSVACEGKELLCDVEATSDSSLQTQLGSSSTTVQALLALVSKRFTIPLRQLRTTLEATTSVTWSELKGICQLRTDVGGVSDDITIALNKE
jgi:predicted nucleic acid-binding protein